MRKLFSVFLALAVLMLSGCGLAEKAMEKAAEKAVEKATGVSVDEKSGEVTFKGQDGQTVTVSGENTGAKVPEGFPMPIFPGSKVKSGGKVVVNGKTSYTVELSFTGEAKPVADFYEKALKDRGAGDVFRSDTSSEDEDNAVLSGQTDKWAASLFIQSLKKDKEGTVAITYGDK